MASDNIDIDPGTGASKLPVATDDCGAAGHIQRVKLDIGGDGVSQPFTDPATQTTLAAALTSLQLLDNAVSGAGFNVTQFGGSNVALGNGSVLSGSLRVTIASDSTGQIIARGTAAHDAAISGNPVRIAGRAMTADYTSVASGDTADILCDTKGKIINLPFALHENHWQYAGAAITDTADDVVKASAGAGLRNYITSLTVTNSHATVGTVVEVKDGSTVIHRGYAAPAGGGYAVTFPTPLKGTAATAINVANITTGSNTYVSMSGYTAP